MCSTAHSRTGPGTRVTWESHVSGSGATGRWDPSGRRITTFSAPPPRRDGVRRGRKTRRYRGVVSRMGPALGAGAGKPDSTVSLDLRGSRVRLSRQSVHKRCGGTFGPDSEPRRAPTSVRGQTSTKRSCRIFHKIARAIRAGSVDTCVAQLWARQVSPLLCRPCSSPRPATSPFS